MEVGAAVMSRLRGKGPGAAASESLAGQIARQSAGLREHVGAGPTARDTRGGLVEGMRAGDRRRDRAVSSLYMGLRAWMMRDDQPDKQRDASLVQAELLPEGPGIVQGGHTEQTAAMKTLVEAASGGTVALAIGRLGLG